MARRKPFQPLNADELPKSCISEGFVNSAQHPRPSPAPHRTITI